MRGCQARKVPLFLVLFFVIFFLFEVIAIFAGLALLLFLFFFLVEVIGDEVQVHRMGLRDFELGFALGTTQNLAFLDFVFIHIDFGGTFRTTNHGSSLPTLARSCGGTRTAPPSCSVLYTEAWEVNLLPACLPSTLPLRYSRASANGLIQRIPRAAPCRRRWRNYRSRAHRTNSPRRRASPWPVVHSRRLP